MNKYNKKYFIINNKLKGLINKRFIIRKYKII